MDPQEELVRLKVMELRRSEESQSETILALKQAGFAPSRIAELLGTTPNTVNVALQRAKKRGKPKRPEK
jgi:DNA-directed RNA polymerase specialized sigma24 family protein